MFGLSNHHIQSMIIKRFTCAVILLICIGHCWNFKTFLLEEKSLANKWRLIQLTTNIKSAAQYNLNELFQSKKEVPEDCSQREKMKNQPLNNSRSRLTKCCPIGESISITDESLQHCYSTTRLFNPNIIHAVLYDNCVEDNELDITLPYEIGNPCNMSFLFNDRDDVFYILQDGSLLIIDAHLNNSFSVEKKYCMDVDIYSGDIYAIVCITSVEEHLNRSQVLTVGILMLVSIPCLLIVSFLHIFVKELRTIHGLLVSLMSLCLATGFFLHSLAYIFDLSSTCIGYAIQWFILSYYFCFFSMCCNVSLNIWIYIPLRKKFLKITEYTMFIIYLLITLSVPTGLVIWTIQKGLPGMPSYFIRGFTESIRESQRYFIPPVSAILALSFVITAISFFGFQRIKLKKVTAIDNTSCLMNKNYAEMQYDEEYLKEVQQDAKCSSFLLLIMITTWLLEIVTFYSPGPEKYLVFMEMINGVQGVLILLIFAIVGRRRMVIIQWWHDRGSHNIDDIELSETHTLRDN